MKIVIFYCQYEIIYFLRKLCSVVVRGSKYIKKIGTHSFFVTFVKRGIHKYCLVIILQLNTLPTVIYNQVPLLCLIKLVLSYSTGQLPTNLSYSFHHHLFIFI